MTFFGIVGLFFYLLAGLLIAGLFLIEVRTWIQDRRDPLARRPAAFRLFRRGLGAFLLVAVLTLLKFPSADRISPHAHLMKLLACLLLCAAVVAVVIWDFRVIRRQMKREVKGFVEKSAQDLRQYLKEIAAKRHDDSS